MKLQGKRVIGRYRHRRDRSTHLNRKSIGVDRLRRGAVVNKVTKCPTLVSNVNCVRALCCRHWDRGWWGGTRKSHVSSVSV